MAASAQALLPRKSMYVCVCFVCVYGCGCAVYLDGPVTGVAEGGGHDPVVGGGLWVIDVVGRVANVQHRQETFRQDALAVHDVPACNTPRTTTASSSSLRPSTAGLNVCNVMCVGRTDEDAVDAGLVHVRGTVHWR